MLRTTKPPRCKQCRRRLEQLRPGQVVHEGCVEDYVARLRADRTKAAKKTERAQTRERRQAMETIPDLIKVADKAFADFIRERDRQAGYDCISSGKPLDWSGNQVDAGHYRSRGAASHLRYSEINCHAQSKYENRHRAGNAVDYRIGLIARIGLVRVEALEASNEPHKWTREELRSIAATYRQKLKDLKKERQEA